MLRDPRVLLLAGSLLFPSLTAAAQEALPLTAPEEVGLRPAELREVTELLNRFVAEQKIAGAVAAVARNGKLAYLESVGYQDLVSRTRMTENSLFRIYSMSKTITAVAVMMLQEEGRFQMADPVSKFLPEFSEVRVLIDPDDLTGATRPPAREIRVEDLLLHTSGLSHRTSELYTGRQVRSRDDSFDEFIAKITRAPLMEDPGTNYRYSESPTVLGRLVEIWSGLPFDIFLEERLFGPLGMTDTGFWAVPEQRSRLTTVHTPAEGGGLRPIELEEPPFTERPTLLEGAIGLVSTVPDYLRFSQMLLNRGELDGVRILDTVTVDMITRNGLSEDLLQARGGAGWGLANVQVVPDPEDVSYPGSGGEYARGGSAGTMSWIDPSTGLIAVIMTPSSPSFPDSLRDRFKSAVDAALVD